MQEEGTANAQGKPDNVARRRGDGRGVVSQGARWAHLDINGGLREGRRQQGKHKSKRGDRHSEKI